jgi:hypothetical protein
MTKSSIPSEDLTWKVGMRIEEWNANWRDDGSEGLLAEELYTGRTTKNQLEVVSKHKGAIPYIISAGAGLIAVNEGIRIPSYDATFGKGGVSFSDWWRLPHGGISNINLNKTDKIVVFAPPSYVEAISLDPEIKNFLGQLITSKKNKLGKISKHSVDIHPRFKEVLKIGAVDLNTELIRIFLESGISGIEEINEKASRLKPPPVRRKVSDDELMILVSKHAEGKSKTELVRHLRDVLQVSASVERISAALNSVI